MTTPSFDLQRFVDAQDPVMPRVLQELRAGRKTSHWMWFVFPQLAGLGTSTMAQRYAIASPAEARAYLAHPVLGARLRECCDLLLRAPTDDPHAIFGSPDDLKLRSCLTLFAEADPGATPFDACLRRFYAGERDPRTLELLRASGAG